MPVHDPHLIKECLELITANKDKSLDALQMLAFAEGFTFTEFQAAVKQYIDGKNWPRVQQ